MYCSYKSFIKKKENDGKLSLLQHSLKMKIKSMVSVIYYVHFLKVLQLKTTLHYRFYAKVFVSLLFKYSMILWRNYTANHCYNILVSRVLLSFHPRTLPLPSSKTRQAVWLGFLKTTLLQDFYFCFPNSEFLYIARSLPWLLMVSYTILNPM